MPLSNEELSIVIDALDKYIEEVENFDPDVDITKLVPVFFKLQDTLTNRGQFVKVYTLLLTEGELNSLKTQLESDNYVNYDNDLKSVVEKIGYFYEPQKDGTIDSSPYNDIPDRY